MREISFVQAIKEALCEEMRRDSHVFLMGEDVRFGGAFGTAKGLVDEFGPKRVFNTPITEASVVGTALGASLMGMRPIVDLMMANFFYVAMDQFANQAAKLRYMFDEQVNFPVVYMAVAGAFGSAAAQHSDSPYPMLMNLGGVKVVVPSNPRDAKGLLKAAIRDNNPVIYFEPAALVAQQNGEVPEEEYIIPLGEADVKVNGNDVTVLGIGAMVNEAIVTAEKLIESGVRIEVVDPRTLVPMDWETIFRSVNKTRHLVIVEEARQTCGAGAEIAAKVSDECFGNLKAPIKRLAVPDVPIPFSPTLEAMVLPNSEKIAEAVLSVLQNHHPKKGT